MAHVMWSGCLFVYLVRFLKSTGVPMDSNISAVSCVLCRSESVLDFCAIWFRLMSGMLPES